MQKIKKKGDASIRVLETLKLLSHKKASANDLIKHLENVNPQTGVYTNEAISKYINTLKVFGFKFEKEKDKFVLLNAFPQFEFDESELQGLKLLDTIANEFPESKIKLEINEFLQNIEHKFSTETISLAQNISKPKISNNKIISIKNQEKINTLEKYCIDRLKIKLTYTFNNEKISIIAEPNEINYIKNKIFFNVYNTTTAQIQEIDINDIIKISQLPSKSNSVQMASSVTFELKDRLAKAYKFKENERLLNTKPNGNIIVLNQNEDQNLLLKRLLRYGENCEIISPKTLREEMLNTISATIANYQ